LTFYPKIIPSAIPRSFPTPSLNTFRSFVFELSCGQTESHIHTYRHYADNRRTHATTRRPRKYNYIKLPLNKNNNNNNNHDNFCGAVTQPIQGRRILGSSNECRAAPIYLLKLNQKSLTAQCRIISIAELAAYYLDESGRLYTVRMMGLHYYGVYMSEHLLMMGRCELKGLSQCDRCVYDIG